jgi:hypothetical protein
MISPLSVAVLAGRPDSDVAYCLNGKTVSIYLIGGIIKQITGAR